MSCSQKMLNDEASYLPRPLPMNEGYDPNSSVCDNQDDFNIAFRKAIKYTNKEDVKKMGNWVYVYVILWAIFFVWAIILAMKTRGNVRTIHLIFAIIASPVYVLAYYLNMLSSPGGIAMSMCGGRPMDM